MLYHTLKSSRFYFYDHSHNSMSHAIDDYQDFAHQPMTNGYSDGGSGPSSYAYQQPLAIPGQYQVASQSGAPLFAESNYAQTQFGGEDVQQQTAQSQRQPIDIVLSQAAAKIDNAMRQFGSNCQTAHFQLTPEETAVVTSAANTYYETHPLPEKIQAEINQSSQQQHAFVSNGGHRMGGGGGAHMGGGGGMHGSPHMGGGVGMHGRPHMGGGGYIMGGPRYGYGYGYGGPNMAAYWANAILSPGYVYPPDYRYGPGYGYPPMI